MQNKDGWDGFKKLIRLCKHMKYNISPFYNILKGVKMESITCSLIDLFKNIGNLYNKLVAFIFLSSSSLVLFHTEENLTLFTFSVILFSLLLISVVSKSYKLYVKKNDKFFCLNTLYYGLFILLSSILLNFSYFISFILGIKTL
ncbi:hypothetical protein A9G08_09940 [Gilliamella sp. wkB195]|uniref:hypothetical protein n=1 Tax=Gilliamella sp. wkB195 TaxID=3120261 RepID=UPI00080E7557|nr:hypothetical protein [Gilliamella apicola]OCF97151.1 hypothetical protein A9G08_09940 [Gilliamella apicola]